MTHHHCLMSHELADLDMAPHLWLWCSEATQKTWLCNETARCNASRPKTCWKYSGFSCSMKTKNSGCKGLGIWVQIHSSPYFSIQIQFFRTRVILSKYSTSNKSLRQQDNTSQYANTNRKAKLVWLSFSLAALRGMCTFSMRGCPFVL